MLRRLRSIVLVALAAVAGALAGRLALELRRRTEAGEPLDGALRDVSLDPRTLSPRELVPGIVAAVRVRDVPWSYLHIPSWLAALAVNFGAAALARELAQLGELTRGGFGGPPPWEPGGWGGDGEPEVEVRDAEPGSTGAPAPAPWRPDGAPEAPPSMDSPEWPAPPPAAGDGG